jgi:hypothetical protein
MLTFRRERGARETNHGAKNDKEAKPTENGGDSAGLKDGFAHFQMGQTRIREPIRRLGEPLGWGASMRLNSLCCVVIKQRLRLGGKNFVNFFTKYSSNRPSNPAQTGSWPRRS